VSKKIRVGIIFGGKSGEHEVSLASAYSVARAIDREKYDVVMIGVTKQGGWLAGDNVLAQLAAASPTPLLKNMNDAEPVKNEDGVAGAQLAPLAAQNAAPPAPLGAIDVAFPLLHGPFGEDGTVQGLLELAGIPYVGAGVAASAVGMDKALMKAIFCAHDLPVADWIVILRNEWQNQPEETIRRVETAFGYPCFVKPANLGSSVGITKAHHWDELTQALAIAAQYDRKIIAERAIDAREIECSVLGNDAPIASLPGEIIPQREFYDYTAKYADDSGTELIVPANIPAETARHAQELALAAFRAIDGSGMARVDFFLERASGRLMVNEINTIPGFTSVSMYPQMWQASGIPYPELIDRLIQLALERDADKQKNRTSYQ